MSCPGCETKSFSDSTQKPSQFWPPTQKPSQSNFTLTTSHYRPARKKTRHQPPHNDQVSFDLDTKIKSFRTPTQKPSQFQSPHRNQAISIRTKKTGHFLSQDQNLKFHTVKPSHIWDAHENKVNFHCRHKNQANVDLHTQTKSISIPHTKSIWISTPTLKSHHFR